jgi:hypothetical protein
MACTLCKNGGLSVYEKIVSVTKFIFQFPKLTSRTDGVYMDSMFGIVQRDLSSEVTNRPFRCTV